MELINMLKDMGYKDAAEMCNHRAQYKDRLGVPMMKINMVLVNSIMDFQVGRIESFRYSCMIISDRLYEYGISFAYYVKKNTNGHVIGVFEKSSQAEAYLQQEIDYLIFFGYQNDQRNYNIIKQVRNQHNPPHVVMVATLDLSIIDICNKYNIIYNYDKRTSLSNLINYLYQIRFDSNSR